MIVQYINVIFKNCVAIFQICAVNCDAILNKKHELHDTNLSDDGFDVLKRNALVVGSDDELEEVVAQNFKYHTYI